MIAAKLDAEQIAARDAGFRSLYGFLVAAASLHSRSTIREEAVVGQRVLEALLKNRKKAKAEVLKP